MSLCFGGPERRGERVGFERRDRPASRYARLLPRSTSDPPGWDREDGGGEHREGGGADEDGVRLDRGLRLSGS